ncbi:hypothetical protein [Wielerella bovis]|uniref:hypothetical protein n=1 Tax=Wielerella bovis TaxID=2917790 RepID=UPI0020197AB0|nr:hypothetical protein [Wielerella bovis]ULJ66673.1 hypothetical protein MIS31_10560 [Wielerella bovis]
MNETLQDFVLQGFCASGWSLDRQIDFEPIAKRDVVGIAPFVVPTPSVVSVPSSTGRMQRDFTFVEPSSGSLNIGRDAVDFSFAPDVPIRGDNLTLFAAGFDAVDFGQPETWLFDTLVSGNGFQAAFFGKPKLVNRNQVVSPKSWAGMVFGRGRIWNVSQSLVPKGLDATQWGSLNLSPRFVYLRGLDSAIFGRGTIFNANQYVQAIGLDALACGYSRFISMRRVLDAAGFSAGTVGQFSRVSERVRGLHTQGYDASELGIASMSGGVRTIAPPSLPFMVGYTRQIGNIRAWADGEANIPVNKTINERYSVWSFGWLGIATIANRNQRVRLDGLDALAMGGAYVAEPVQMIETRGFDATEWGWVYRWANEKLPRTWDNPALSSWQKDYWGNKPNWTSGLTVFNDKRPIWVRGFDEALDGVGLTAQSRVSKPLIAFDKRVIAPHGFDALGMRQYGYNGNGYLVGRTEYYTIGGGRLTVFGQTVVSNLRLKQITANGWNAQQFGRGDISLRKLGVNGFDAAVLGAAKVGGGLFQGFDATEWGIAWISHAVRTISGSLNDAAALGVPSLRDTRLLASSVVEAGVFGDIRVANRNRTLAAKSVEWTERVSEWASVRLTDRWLTLSGFETFAMGKPDVQLWIRTIYADSVGKTDVFAIGMVADRVRTLHVGAFVATEFGVSTWQREPILPPKGFVATEFGQPEIYNRNKFVRTGNFDFTQMGGGTVVDYFSRWIKAEDKGIDAAQWGMAWLSHDRRALAMRGIDTEQVGKAWVSFGAREIVPTGFLAQDFRLPKIGGTQMIVPESWDSASWGERIIPARRLLDSLLGFDTAIWGQTCVFNRLQTVVPNGFELVDKFGHTAIWLMRQYVRQIHDDLGGLAPPVWDGWTSIANRNKMLVAFGIVPSRVAEPTIHNAARVLAAVGFDVAQVGKQMIAFRVRGYRLDGIEPVRISDWHSVHNAARVLSPFGIAPEVFRQPEIYNTRREYRWITVGDGAQYGTAMVDFAVRELVPYQGIMPEYVPMPTVFNLRQDVRVNGFDALAVGAMEAAIHWNIIAPKTHFQAAFGWVDIRNVTPELHFTGKDMVECGVPYIGLWTRYLGQPESINDGAVGVPVIGDRRKTLLPAGWLSWHFGWTNVWHLTTPVHYSRVIYPPSIFKRLDDFGTPDLHKNTLEASGIAAMKVGEPSVWSNTVRVDIGIGTDGVGEPSFILRRRVLDLHDRGIAAELGYGQPVLSPMTIWCRGDAPSQAKNNHKGVWHAIDAYEWQKFGTPKLMLRGTQVVRTYGLDRLRLGGVVIENWRRYIAPTGWHNGRLGWVIVGDGTQSLVQFHAPDVSVFGAHQVGFVASRDKRVLVRGWHDGLLGKPWVSLWRQNVLVRGWQSMVFGSSRESSTAYMPQTLAVYFPKPVLPAHWDSAAFGQTRIGLFTRTVSPNGWDSLVSEYDVMNFKARMRVSRGGRTVAAQGVRVQGMASAAWGMADVSHRVRYIRPDGFMDNFRKGVANV